MTQSMEGSTQKLNQMSHQKYAADDYEVCLFATPVDATSRTRVADDSELRFEPNMRF